jgi:hypothetical protein
MGNFLRSDDQAAWIGGWIDQVASDAYPGYQLWQNLVFQGILILTNAPPNAWSISWKP